MTFIFGVINMKIVNIVALILNIIGGINWGLVGHISLIHMVFRMKIIIPHHMIFI